MTAQQVQLRSLGRSYDGFRQFSAHISATRTG
jgi:hypothetical protein